LFKPDFIKRLHLDLEFLFKGVFGTAMMWVIALIGADLE
jgi:hypothetical protein